MPGLDLDLNLVVDGGLIGLESSLVIESFNQNILLVAAITPPGKAKKYNQP